MYVGGPEFIDVATHMRDSKVISMWFFKQGYIVNSEPPILINKWWTLLQPRVCFLMYHTKIILEYATLAIQVKNTIQSNWLDNKMQTKKTHCNTWCNNFIITNTLSLCQHHHTALTAWRPLPAPCLTTTDTQMHGKNEENERIEAWTFTQ